MVFTKLESRSNLFISILRWNYNKLTYTSTTYKYALYLYSTHQQNKMLTIWEEYNNVANIIGFDQTISRNWSLILQMCNLAPQGCLWKVSPGL